MKQSLLKKLWLRTSLLVAVILCGAGTAWGQNEVEIGTVEQLKAFRDAVNSGNQYAGKTVKLTADLDLSGESNWTPIGNLVAYPGQSFDGVFDGQNHVISNLTVNDNTSNYATAALFGSVEFGTIKNLTVKNVNITSTHYAAGIVAYTSNTPTIENCHVIGGSIKSTPEIIDGSYDNGDKAGGIMGYATAGSTINKCTVEGVTISGYRDLGGIVGYSAGNVTNNTVKNVTVTQDLTNGYKNPTPTTIGDIIGRNEGATLSNNTVIKSDPVAQIGETKYETLAEAVAAANTGDVIEIIKAGNYTLPNLSKNVTIEGKADGVVFKDIVANPTNENNIASIPSGATFKNVAFEVGNIDYHGFTHAGIINMEGCTLNGKLFSYGDMNFTNCEFVHSGDYNMWVYGQGNVVYDGCIFTNNTKGKMLHLYCEDANQTHKVTVKNCKFVNKGELSKSAINVKATSGSNALQYELYLEGNNTYEGSFPTAVGEQDNSDHTWILSPLVQVDDRKVSPDNIKVYKNNNLIYPEAIAKIGDVSYPSLQSALDVAHEMTGDVMVELLKDIEGYSIVRQKAGLNLTINGAEKTVNGQIIIDGDGRASGTETLAIQNVKFEGNTTNFYSGTDAFILVPSTKATGTPFYTNKYNYAHNITVSNCSFTSTSESLNVVGVKANSNAGAYNVVLSGNTGTNLHSLAQLTGTTGATFQDCQLTESDSFVNIDGGAGEFNFTGCTFVSSTDDGYAVREKGASMAAVTLTDCNFTAAKVIQLGKNDAPKGSISVVSGTYNGSIVRNTTDASTATIAISGGYFSEEIEQEFIEEGLVCIPAADKPGFFTVGEPTYVAQIGETKYMSLQAAVNAVPADGSETTITMIDDETIVGNAGVTIPVGKNVVLDLNGKTVTLNVTESKGSQLLTNNGTLTITDSSEGQTGKLTNAADESLAVGSWPTNNYATNIITNCGTLNVEGGNIVSTANGSICYAVDNNSTSYDAILNIKGGYLTSVGTVVRQFCNSTAKQNELNISGGTVETNGYAALWTQLPGSSASSKKLATLNITGGKVKGSTYAWYDYSYGDSFEAVNYSISGGELSGYLYSYAVAQGVKPGFITGGLFTKDAVDLCAEGLTFIDNTDEATKEDYPYIIGEANVIYSYLYNGEVYNENRQFEPLFVKGWISNDESITLLKNVTLTENIACQLAEGSFNFTLGEYSVTKGEYSISLLPNVTVLTDKQTDIFSAAEIGYVIEEAEVEGGYSYTAVVAAPIVFHDGGTYEGALTVPMLAQTDAEIYYSTDGENFAKYTQPITISSTTTVTAYATLLGAESKKVSKTFTIVEKQAGAEVADGYYNIKTSDGKYVNVAGRKTVTLASDTKSAGTVIRVSADANGVKVLRSQGVDVPGYAKKAMNYVPEIVQLAVDKLHAEGSGAILGEHGLDAIMEEFNKSFDYNLYLEKSGDAYRIYGRTPSMKPVVDFYAKNKANVDAKLPQLEGFINSAIDKVLQKTGGRGASILVDFKLHDVWQNMPGKLTEPTDEASTLKFYEEVLSSETNVWNFAYQTAMIYWGNVKNHPRFAEIKNKLGDYAKYIDKVENIRPNFKYYIVPSGSGVDFISEGNEAIINNNASAAWTMQAVTTFQVELPTEKNVTVYPTSGGTQTTYKEYYTTLYTDFAYTLPKGVKAYKVTAITDQGVAKREEITGTIPAQTPVLLVGESNTATLTLSTEAGTAITDNLLVGPDALINEYKIKTPQVVSLFDFAKSILGESAYDTYVKKYEHLMLKNAGTLNNKYFFGLSNDDLGKCADEEGLIPVRSLGNKDGQPCFYENWVAGANQAFLVTMDHDPVMLFLVGDVNRDGIVSIADVTALVNIILGKAKYPADNDKYDFEAANVNGDEIISIADVTALVNIILGK